MIFDAHVHIGQFFDILTSANELSSLLKDSCVDKCAVSSTSIAEENYPKVLSEIREFVNEFGEENTYPVLWLTPNIIDNEDIIKQFLESGIKWTCLKVHPELHPYQWAGLGKNMKKVIQLSKRLKLPILIHTGSCDFCNAGSFKRVIKKNYGVTFILAHGRPIDEAINVIKTCKNAFLDTAFMSPSNIKLLCDLKLADKVLWGTDVPIPKYFNRDIQLSDYYKKQIQYLKKLISENDFNKITCLNFLKVFY